MKKKYLIIPLILILTISLILTYYNLSKPKRYNIKVNNLKYALTVAGILNDTVKIPANTIIKPAIVIKSYNNKKANYLSSIHLIVCIVFTLSVSFLYSIIVSILPVKSNWPHLERRVI